MTERRYGRACPVCPAPLRHPHVSELDIQRKIHGPQVRDCATPVATIPGVFGLIGNGQAAAAPRGRVTGKWPPPVYEIPIEWYADLQRMLDTITLRMQTVKNRKAGRESIRWVYEDHPGEVRRLVVGIDEDDGVPIVFSLHRR